MKTHLIPGGMAALLLGALFYVTVGVGDVPTLQIPPAPAEADSQNPPALPPWESPAGSAGSLAPPPGPNGSIGDPALPPLRDASPFNPPPAMEPYRPLVEEPSSAVPPPMVPQSMVPYHEPAGLMPPSSARPHPPAYHGYEVVPGAAGGASAWQPGGDEARRGRPDYYTAPGETGPLYTVQNQTGTPWAIDHSAYRYHFGPGFYRHSEAGHYRFPYYTYRAPWYFPGHPIFNRDTNRPW